MKCPNCGAENTEGKRFCGDCGATLPQPPPSIPRESLASQTRLAEPAPKDWRIQLILPTMILTVALIVVMAITLWYVIEWQVDDLAKDSDGDGVLDATDVAPFDPAYSSLASGQITVNVTYSQTSVFDYLIFIDGRNVGGGSMTQGHVDHYYQTVTWMYGFGESSGSIDVILFSPYPLVLNGIDMRGLIWEKTVDLANGGHAYVEYTV